MTKVELLSFVEQLKVVAAREVATGFDIDIRQACVFLRRNWAAGYLRRRKIGRRFFYALSAHGGKHLAWLLDH